MGYVCTYEGDWKHHQTFIFVCKLWRGVLVAERCEHWPAGLLVIRGLGPHGAWVGRRADVDGGSRWGVGRRGAVQACAQVGETRGAAGGRLVAAEPQSTGLRWSVVERGGAGVRQVGQGMVSSPGISQGGHLIW